MTTKAEALSSLRPGIPFRLIGDELEWLEDGVVSPSEAEIQAEIARLATEQAWRKLRQQRDQLLLGTDFYGLSDQAMPENVKIYRQKLRDLPGNTSDPYNPDWPSL